MVTISRRSPARLGVGEGRQVQYESNPKHAEPWQRGGKGSLCTRDIKPLAQWFLEESVLVGDKRYAFHEGKAYCAQEHRPEHWHGYPVGWKEVPAPLVQQWIKAGRIKRRDRQRYWESHA